MDAAISLTKFLSLLRPKYQEIAEVLRVPVLFPLLRATSEEQR